MKIIFILIFVLDREVCGFELELGFHFFESANIILKNSSIFFQSITTFVMSPTP